jgi:hypothetical protein
MFSHLTSADECVDVLDLPDGRVVAVGHQALHGVEQAVDVEDGAGVADLGLEFAEPPPAVFVDRPHPRFSARTWDRCYDFKNIFAQIFGENIGVFCSNYC